MAIEEAIAVEGDARLGGAPAILAPGEEVTVTVEQPLQGMLGVTSRRYALVTDEPGVARYRFSLTGFVESAFEPEIPTLQFGKVGSGLGIATVEVVSREVEELQVRPVGPLPGEMAIEVASVEGDPQALTLEAVLAPDAPLGITEGAFLLETNVPTHPELEVRYGYAYYGAVVPERNPLMVLPAEAGTPMEDSFRLVSEEPFEIVSVEADFEVVTLESTPCAGDSPSSCWTIRFRTPPRAIGPFAGSLEVVVAGESRPLPLRVLGIGIPPGTELKTIDISGGA